MDKRRFIHKLNKILSRFRLITDVKVSYTDFIIITFTRTHKKKLWMIQTFFTEDELIYTPQKLIEWKLQWRLEELYE